MNKVSVITPLYNCKKYIEAAINSVIAQTYDNWELIIVDDSSTDGGDEIAKHFAKNNHKIRFYKNKKNLGGAETRNIAIEKAEGRFIAFLDADDIWDPEKIQKQIDFMAEKNIGFCFANYTTINQHGTRVKNIKTPSRVSLQEMYSHNYIGCLTAIYDTNYFGKFYMPNVRKRQDYALWLTMLHKFDYAHSLQETVAFYRVRPNSLSSNKIDAIKYYWKVLQDIEKLPTRALLYYTAKYIILTSIKMHFPKMYSFIYRI